MGEDRLAVLEERLDGAAHGRHVAHLELDGCGTHDGGCEDDGEVVGGHLQKHISL